MMVVALQRMEAVGLQAQSRYGLAQTGRVFGFLRLVLGLGCWLQFFDLEMMRRLNGNMLYRLFNDLAESRICSQREASTSRMCAMIMSVV